MRLLPAPKAAADMSAAVALVGRALRRQDFQDLLRGTALAGERIHITRQLQNCGREKPFDCAGAAKIERLGIALMASVESDDPTSLIGLPLMTLTTMLAAAGVEVLPGLAGSC